MRAPSLAPFVLACACFADTPPLDTAADTDTDAATGSGSTGTDASTLTSATDDPTTDSAIATASTLDASASDDSATGEGACGADRMCVELPAGGWMGPFALAFIDPRAQRPPCVAPYEEPSGMALHEGIEPGAIDCGCSCGQPVVDPCLAALTTYPSDDMCGFGVGGEFDLAPGACTATGGANSIAYDAQPGDPPSCFTGTAPLNVQPSGWAQDVVLCGLAEPGPPCESGTCVAAGAGPFTAVCVLHDGVEECPGDFADQRIVYLDLDDQRECEMCSCEAIAADCTPVVFRSGDVTCGDVDGGQTGCIDTSGMAVFATTWQPTALAECQPMQNVSGAVEGVGAHTLCCR